MKIEGLLLRLSGRDLAVVRSLVTGLGAKGCGVLLQIIATPYAIRVLGVQKYGVYATAVALFGWASLLEVGIGSNVVTGIVSGLARKDSQCVGQIFSNGILIATILGLSSSAAAFAIFLLYSNFTAGVLSREYILLFAVAAILSTLQITSSMGVRARSAFQETHVNNIFSGCANLISALLLLTAIAADSSVVVLLLALNAPIILAQLINTAMLLRRERGILSKTHLNRSNATTLLKGGGWVALAQGGVFLEREAPKLIIATMATAAAVGRYACAVQVMMILAGLVTIVSAPLLPAVASAIEANDHIWWRRRVSMVHVAILGVGIAAAALAYLNGAALISRLYGPGLSFSNSEVACLMVWITTVLLSHILYVVLLAAGRVAVIAIWQLLQGSIIALFFSVFHAKIDLSPVFLIAGGATLLITFLPWSKVVAGLARSS